MSRRSAIVVGLAAAVSTSCISHMVGRFVREVHVYRNDLVVEKCELMVGGEVGECSTESRRLPMTADLSPTLTHAQIEAGADRARAALVACGAKHHVGGIVPVRVKISYSGHVLAVEPSAGGEDFMGCVGEALEEAHFPMSAHGAELSLKLELPQVNPLQDEPSPTDSPTPASETAGADDGTVAERKALRNSDPSQASLLSKPEILAGLSVVKPAALACGAKYGGPGTVWVKFVISPSGLVATASAIGSYAGTPTGSCVEAAVKTATFRAIPEPQIVTYPFVLP